MTESQEKSQKICFSQNTSFQVYKEVLHTVTFHLVHKRTPISGVNVTQTWEFILRQGKGILNMNLEKSHFLLCHHCNLFFSWCWHNPYTLIDHLEPSLSLEQISNHVLVCRLSPWIETQNIFFFIFFSSCKTLPSNHTSRLFVDRGEPVNLNFVIIEYLKWQNLSTEKFGKNGVVQMIDRYLWINILG